MWTNFHCAGTMGDLIADAHAGHTFVSDRILYTFLSSPLPINRNIVLICYPHCNWPILKHNKESRIFLEPHRWRCETVDTSVEWWRHTISLLRNYMINVFQNQRSGWLSECGATVRRHRMKMILWVEWLQSETLRTASMSLMLYIYLGTYILNEFYTYIST